MKASQTPHTDECIAQRPQTIEHITKTTHWWTHHRHTLMNALHKLMDAFTNSWMHCTFFCFRNWSRGLSLWCQHGFKGFFVLSVMVLQCCCSVLYCGTVCCSAAHSTLKKFRIRCQVLMESKAAGHASPTTVTEFCSQTPASSVLNLVQRQYGVPTISRLLEMTGLLCRI